jgi:outer membrane protein assembly factor BamA
MRDGSGYQPRMRALARSERQDLLDLRQGEAEVVQLLATIGTSYGCEVSSDSRRRSAAPPASRRLGHQRYGCNISAALDPLRAAGLDGPQRVGTYNQTASLDRRDHPIDPRSASTPVRRRRRRRRRCLQFIQVVPEVRGYVPIPLPRRFVLAARVRAGAIYGDLPITQRMFSGGASSHRGFGERTLAPFVVDAAGTEIPYGGGALLETGIETRVRIGSFKKMPISGVLFLDGGDVTPRISDLALDNLHWAVGTGLRIHTIVGPVCADLGYRLNRFGSMDSDPGSCIAFHLSLGEVF